MSVRRRIFRVAPMLAAMVLMGSPAGAIWVFYTPKEVIQVAFPDDENVVRVDWKLMTRDVKKAIEEQVGQALLFRRIRCYQGSREDQVLGYACIDNVIGRSRPITYMLKIGHPSGDIVHYEIMVYREEIGKETGFGPFREQFYGKTTADPFEYGEDLRNLSGATLSSIGLRNGFVKLLAVYDHFFKNLPVLDGADG